MCVLGGPLTLSGKPEPGRGFSLNPAVSSPPKHRGLSAALLVPAANTEAPLHRVGWESM